MSGFSRTVEGIRCGVYSVFGFRCSLSRSSSRRHPSWRSRARRLLLPRHPPLPQRRPRRPTCRCGRMAMPSRARRRLPQCRQRRMMDRRKRWRAAQASSRSRRFATGSDRRTGIRAITLRCPRSLRAAAKTATSARARSATIPTEKGARKTRQCPACRSSYFVQQMVDYRNGTRKSADPKKANTNAMIAIAKAMTDEEILARHSTSDR